MYPKTKKTGLFKNKLNKTIKPRKAKFVKTYYPSADNWSMIASTLMLATLIWQFLAVVGWLTGDTMVNQFGMDPILATAITKCPDILFYSTYFALGVSVIMFIVTAFVMHRFVCDEMDACDALNITVLCSFVSVWVFPIIHACADLLATAMDIRDTSGFDVFQLGIDIVPMIVTSVVCIAVLWINKRVDILKR